MPWPGVLSSRLKRLRERNRKSSIMEKRRDIAFDIAKGIGIVLVVIGHYLPANAPK